MTTTQDTFTARRRRVVEAMGEATALWIGERGERHSDLEYLTGLREPEMALVLSPTAAPTLYVRRRDHEQERWGEAGAGLEGAARRSGVEDVRPLEALEAELGERLRGSARLGWRLGRSRRWDRALIDAVSAMGPKVRAPDIVDPSGWVAKLRLVKDAAELEAMRRAGAVTARAVERARGRLGPGVTELALAGAIEAAFREGGAERNAFTSLVAAGERACCLHPLPSRRRVAEGELVLVDVGASWGGYAADMTRTFPVGAPTSAQRDVIAVVQEAHDAAAAVARPGSTLGAVHAAASRSLEANLARLGLPGPLSRWFMHKTSHWIGLDAHDPSSALFAGEEEVTLEPGVTFTVEPGLYIDRDAEDAPAALRGIGVRIEDTVAVTASGHEVLTRA